MNDSDNIIRAQEKINHIEKMQQIQQRDIEAIGVTLKELRSMTDSFIRDIHRDIAAIRVELAKPSGISWSLALTLNALSVMVTALAMYVLTS